MVRPPTWDRVVRRYATPTRLQTVRKTVFVVVAEGDILRVTPGSTGVTRSLTRGDYEKTAPLVGGSSRQALRDISQNASYVVAIVADFESRPG